MSSWTLTHPSLLISPTRNAPVGGGTGVPVTDEATVTLNPATLAKISVGDDTLTILVSFVAPVEYCQFKLVVPPVSPLNRKTANGLPVPKLPLKPLSTAPVFKSCATAPNTIPPVVFAWATTFTLSNVLVVVPVTGKNARSSPPALPVLGVTITSTSSNAPRLKLTTASTAPTATPSVFKVTYTSNSVPTAGFTVNVFSSFKYEAAPPAAFFLMSNLCCTKLTPTATPNTNTAKPTPATTFLSRICAATPYWINSPPVVNFLLFTVSLCFFCLLHSWSPPPPKPSLPPPPNRLVSSHISLRF